MWRIFIPTVAMVWLLMGGILVYQYNREVNYHTENINSQLRIINRYIVDNYERDADLERMMVFLDEYFENTMFNEIRVSIYNATGDLLYYIGRPIPKEFNGEDPITEIRSDELDGDYGLNSDYASDDENDKQDKLFYYKATKSSDGMLYVRTGMPYNVTIADAISSARGLWIFIISLGLFCTVLVYLATRMLSRNIMLLHDFANRAASGNEIEHLYDFPHDELGDISRQIVSLYRSRMEAVSESSREHDIALHAVEEKARIKNQLTNNINHELKTPIGIIKGYLDTILSEPDMPEPTKTKFLERAQANVNRLCGLLNDVSTMTRLEEGQEKIPASEVDFHDLVFQLHSDYKQSNSGGDMKFTYDIPLGCKVRGNTNVLTSLITNLIRNAVMHSRGTAMSLKLLSESPKFYTFSFSDNGTGVPQESIPHLFERFYRVDTGRSRKAGGSGLGLPIVRNVIMVLGGAISVRNKSTGGLEFIFTLPKWQDKKRSLG